jgi:hypothetical protein
LTLSLEYPLLRSVALTRNEENIMSILRLAVVAIVATACASTRIPPSGDPMVAISSAERAIEEAQAAGADSLASSNLAEARTGLEAARAAASKDRNRAALLARKAAADAAYAGAIAGRVIADRARTAAQADLQRVPPPGGER